MHLRDHSGPSPDAATASVPHGGGHVTSRDVVGFPAPVLSVVALVVAVVARRRALRAATPAAGREPTLVG